MQLDLGCLFAARKSGTSVLLLLIVLALSSAQAIASDKSGVWIDSLEREALDAYRRAAALAGDGFISEAVEEYKRAILVDTSGFGAAARAAIKVYRDSLRYLSPSAIPDDFSRMSQGDSNSLTWLRSLHQLIGALRNNSIWIEYCLILVLLGFLVTRFLGREAFDFQEFDTGNVSVTDGKSVRTLIIEKVEKFESGEIRPVIHLISGSSQNLPRSVDFLPTNPMFKVLAAAVDWIPLFKRTTLHGILHPAGPEGVGITLTLRRKDGTTLTETFWQKKFNPWNAGPSGAAGGYHCLFDPAATWIIFNTFASFAWFKPLGTANWRSYAFFQAGVYWSLAGETENARHLYHSALNEDQENYGASLNLAVLELEDAAIDSGNSVRIRECMERLEAVRKRTGRSDVTWNWNRLRPIRAQGVWGWQGWGELRRIWVHGCRGWRGWKEWQGLLWGWWTCKAPIMHASWYTATYQLQGIHLYEEIRRCNHPRPSGSLVKELMEEMALAIRHCRIQKFIHSMTAFADRSLDVIPEWRNQLSQSGRRCDRLLDFLTEFQPMAKMLHWTVQGREGEERAEYEKSGRYLVRYNLACFLSTVPKDYARALRHLDFALARGTSIAKWAKLDPSLSYLRCDLPVEFNLCVNRFREGPGHLPLGEILRIGPGNAALMHRKAGIIDATDLLAFQNGRTLQAGSKYLARVLSDEEEARAGLEKKISAWFLLARLMKLDGMTGPYLNLLDAAGISSAQELSSQEPGRLYRRLGRFNRRYAMVGELPNPALLRSWIDGN